jgi:hypothetical protein
MPKPGRNDLCHCASGRKYKKCCLEHDREIERGERPAFTIDGSQSPTVNDGHIVPRVFQAAWADEESKVAVHKVGGEGCRPKSTKRVMTRGPHYRRTRPTGETTDDVEDSLRRIEDKASDPLKGLVSGEVLDEEAKGILAQFFSVQMFRGPAFFAQREELIRPALEAASREDFTEYGLAAAGGDVEVVRKRVIDAYLDPTKSFVTMIAYAVKVASVLGVMRWQALRFEEPLLAYSDHPVVLWPIGEASSAPFARQGIGALGTLEIRVPISPKAAILMNWIPQDDDYAVWLPPSAAAELNAFTVSQAEEEWAHKLGREPEIGRGTFKPLSRLIDPSYDREAVAASARHRHAAGFLKGIQGRQFMNEVEVLVTMA